MFVRENDKDMDKIDYLFITGTLTGLGIGVLIVFLVIKILWRFAFD